MKKNSLILLLSLLILLGCKINQSPQRNAFVTGLMNETVLPLQQYEVTVRADTLLKTSHGATVFIPQNAIKTKDGSVKALLKIREAYSMEEMIAAGLSTQTADGQQLSSGGMIYIDATNATVEKALSIAVPTQYNDTAMQLFKGKATEGEPIVWEEEGTLKDDSLNEMMKWGRTIFETNCTSCHKIEQRLTGPALLHIASYHDINTLARFTRNPAGTMATNCHFQEVKKEYGQVMQAFPALTSRDIDAIYGYITQESYKIAPAPTQKAIDAHNHIADNDDCCRFCEEFGVWVDSIRQAEKESMVNDEYQHQDLSSAVSNEATNSYPTYYSFDINAFGWFNIDKYMLANNSASLKVKLDKPATDIGVFLTIPEDKIFMDGIQLNEKPFWGFKNMDGSLPLPADKNCVVFAVGKLADGTLVFGQQKFNAAKEQTFTLQMYGYSKEEIQQKIYSVGLSRTPINVFDEFSADSNFDNSDSAKIKKRGNGFEFKNWEKIIEKAMKCGCYIPEEIMK